MTYRRVVDRNRLGGDYAQVCRDMSALDATVSTIAGDLRRLEADQRDEAHLALYAERAGVTPAQAKAVLDCFFNGFDGGP